jgi:signal transduction histidine kinase/CheY-like chemotaxis protein
MTGTDLSAFQSPRGGQADEIAALRTELEDTSRGLMAVFAELSARTEELEQARAAAVRANEAKAVFLASMSHEIRSPLNAVIGFASLLADASLDPELAEFVEMIRAAGNHLRGLIDDILDLSKIESGRLELEAIGFDVIGCVEEALEIVAPLAEEKGLALSALFDERIPVSVVGDPVRLRQVLVNLLSNAVKFTERGHVSVEVVPDPDEPAAEGRYRLAANVTDTGIGIPADKAERIFAPFTQAEASTTRQFGGTGLGLAIARQLAERMGGGIAVRSQPGLGSTFTCTVDVAVADPTSLATAEDRLLAGLSVLVVHREPVVAESVAGHLRTWGAAPTIRDSVGDVTDRAVSGLSFALAILQATGPDEFAADLAALVEVCGATPVLAVASRTVRRALPASQPATSTPVRRAQLRSAILATLERGATAPEPVPGRAPAVGLDILVAEDHPVNQRIAAQILERLGHRVVVVPDGQAAVDAVLAGDYDAVLMDVNMPRLDGVAAARTIRRHRPGTRPRIIALTADSTQETRTRCLDGGMDDFLTKPLDRAALVHALDQVPAARTTRRVLYVDDNPMITKLVERILGREPDLELVVAPDARTAVALAADRPPDLIFLDLHLPDASGEDLLRSLRAVPATRDVPAVIVSGDIAPDVVTAVADLGVLDFLAKPFQPADLRALVQRALPAH